MMPTSAITPTESTPSSELFTEFFELGQQEDVSPFIKPDSRSWATNLTVKASIVAAFLLMAAFAFSFHPSLVPFSNLLLFGVYFLAGIPALIEAIEDLADGEINIDILMTLAAFSSVLIGSGMEGGLLLVLFALSGSMEDAVTNKAKGALSSLHKLSPTRATIVEDDGTLIEKAIRDITVGTRILVKAGQVVPLDGTVVAGASSLNLVHLTGENFPVTKVIGDIAPAGGRNLEGTLTIDVTRTSADSTLARIIQLVTEAQEARPKLQQWFEKASKGYAISIISLSFLFAISLPWILNIPLLGEEGSVYRALAFLIAASPCALIIAIPIAYLSALSACAKRGILLKGGITLDALAGCQAVAFDKTGTLTTGELQCLGIEALHPQDKELEQTALTIAFALEKNAVHPIAGAILRYIENKNLQNIDIKDFKSIPGYGLEATVEVKGSRQSVYIGRASYILSKLPESTKTTLQNRISMIEIQGEQLAVLVIGDKPFILRFTDTIRPNISKMLSALKERKWQTVMLTGDHQQSAERIAKELDITEVHAQLLPEDKLRYVTELSQQKGLVMIGDGVNDAPALARATVGVSMGKVASAAAIDAADVVLLNDNIEKFDWLISKAQQTQNIVKQNLALAVSAIVIASLPALGGIIPLWLAVVLHEGGTVLVGLNALRLLRR